MAHTRTYNSSMRQPRRPVDPAALTPVKWQSTVIKPGDILLAYFPYREALSRPGLDYHPALVLAINRKVNPWQVFVAYGTSKVQVAQAWQFVIPPADDHASAKRASRVKSTMFDLSRTAVLNYNEAWFSCALSKVYPRMGELDAAGVAVYCTARLAFEKHHNRSLIKGQPALPPPGP